MTGPCPQQHPRPDEAQSRIEALLEEDAVLIGPLWPTPGAGRWDGEKLVAAGRYERVIRYHEHMLPLAQAIRAKTEREELCARYAS